VTVVVHAEVRPRASSTAATSAWALESVTEPPPPPAPQNGSTLSLGLMTTVCGAPGATAELPEPSVKSKQKTW
jgi:hypothetical protein